MTKQLHLDPYITAHPVGKQQSWQDVGIAAAKVLLPYLTMAGALLLVR